MPVEYRPPDLVGAYMAGQQIKNARQQREMNAWEMQQKKAAAARDEQSRAAWASGNPEEIQKADPQGFAKWQESQFDLKKKQLDYKTAETDLEGKGQQQVTERAKRSQEFAQRAANALRTDSSERTISSIAKARDEQVRLGLIDPIDIPGLPSDVGPMPAPTKQDVATFGAMAGAAPPPDERTGDIKEFEYENQNPAYKKRRDELAEKRSTKVNNNNIMPGGGVGLTTAQQTTTQGEVNTARKRLFQIANMRNTIAAYGGYDKFGQYASEGGAVASGIGSKLGVKVDAAEMEKRTAAEAAIGGFSNPIISELAGANVPDGEMKRMVQSLPVVGDPGPVLKAKIDAWENNQRIIEKYGIEYLVNGISTGAIKLPGEPAPAEGGGKKNTPPTSGVSPTIQTIIAKRGEGKPLTPEEQAVWDAGMLQLQQRDTKQ